MAKKEYYMLREIICIKQSSIPSISEIVKILI